MCTGVPFFSCRRLKATGVKQPLLLATDPKTLDDRPVTGDFGLGQVLQQPAALPHEEQQPATAVVVVLVRLQVLGEVGDTTREHRDLNLG